MDVEEQRRIVEHRELFVHLMSKRARDPAAWFGATVVDHDCPSGLAVESRVLNRQCVFFRSELGCVLQKGAIEAGLHPWAIKPRFCIMFPLVVYHGTLRVDDDRKSLWCMQARNHTRPVLESVRAELAYLFDSEQLRSFGIGLE